MPSHLLPLVALTSTLTSTASSLFSAEEEIPDLVETEEPGEPEKPAFLPSVRGSVFLEGQAAVDTSFDRPGENIFELSLGGGVEIDADFLPGLSAYAAPRFSHVTAIDRSGGDREMTYLEVPEAHVTWAFGAHHLRVGTQIFNWGSSDLVAPSDVLNPLDMRRGIVGARPETAKIPVFAAELLLGIGPLTVRGVFEPFFTPSRFFLTGWDDSIARVAAAQGLVVPDVDVFLGEGTVDRAGDLLVITDRPNDRPDDATYAARATLGAGDLDLSVSVVYGWESLPRLSFDPNVALLAERFSSGNLELDPALLDAFGAIRDALAEGRPLFEGRYERRVLLGADAVYAADPFVFKLDAAYTFERTLYTQAPSRAIGLPWLNTVLGVEYIDGEELQIIVEAFAITVFDMPATERLLLFEAQEPPPARFGTETRTLTLPGVIVVVRYSVLDGDLVFELGGVSTLTRGDVILLPNIRWRLDDHQELSLGGLLVEGRGDGYGGYYTYNDKVWLGYRWSI